MKAFATYLFIFTALMGGKLCAMQLADLPQDCVVEIISFLKIPELNALAHTSKDLCHTVFNTFFCQNRTITIRIDADFIRSTANTKKIFTQLKKTIENNGEVILRFFRQGTCYGKFTKYHDIEIGTKDMLESFEKIFSNPLWRDQKFLKYLCVSTDRCIFVIPGFDTSSTKEQLPDNIPDEYTQLRVALLCQVHGEKIKTRL